MQRLPKRKAVTKLKLLITFVGHFFCDSFTNNEITVENMNDEIHKQYFRVKVT